MNRTSLVRFLFFTSLSATLGGCIATRDDDDDTGVFGSEGGDSSGDVGDTSSMDEDGEEESSDDGPVTGCGNGIVEGAEMCDDGNDINTDGCLDNCLPNTCGDGYVFEGMEECDDGNDSTEDACLPGCIANTCGDGYVNQGVEECDDGNAVQTDSCPMGCLWNVCGDGLIWVGVEECDDGENNGEGMPCNTECEPNVCGDGDACTDAACTSGPDDGPEDCDDANLTDTDACRNSCTAAVCGDGVLYEGEETCDGTNLGGEQCNTLGFTFGTLTCAAECEHDISQCWSFTGGYCVTNENCYYYVFGNNDYCDTANNVCLDGVDPGG